MMLVEDDVAVDKENVIAGCFPEEVSGGSITGAGRQRVRESVNVNVTVPKSS